VVGVPVPPVAGGSGARLAMSACCCVGTVRRPARKL